MNKIAQRQRQELSLACDQPKLLLPLVILLLVFFAALLANACFGEVSLSPAQVFAALFHGNAGISPAVTQLFWEVRLPRLLVALVVGAGLGISGYLLQALSQNVLADPFLTGASSGAGVCVVLALLLGLDFAFVPLFAFAGGLLVSSVVAGLARSPFGFSVAKLLLAGVAASAICGSVITLAIVGSANLAQGKGISYWLAGGISGANWSEFFVSALYVGASIVVALLMSKPLRLLTLGVPAAKSLGLSVGRTQWILLAVSVLACGAAVSVSGMVGFVGLIAPYIGRRLFASDVRLQMAAAVIVGGTLVLLADLFARTLSSGQELPLGSLLALVGAPFFLWLVVKDRAEVM